MRSPTKSAASAFRDKRYTVPQLTAHLLDEGMQTDFWSSTQFILRNVNALFEIGKTYPAILAADDEQMIGTFDFKVAKWDENKKILGAAFEWFSPEARELLDKVLERRGGGEQPVAGHPIQIFLLHSTINWSFTGLLVDRFFGEMPKGAPFRGVVRVAKNKESGMFDATCVRVGAPPYSLACRFSNLPPNTFAMLELAMKKSL